MLDRLKRLVAYDAIEPKAPSNYRRIAYALILFYVVISAVLIFGSFVDNKPTVASTGLLGIHRTITLNFDRWFSEDIWWRGRQTPAPLPYTGLGIFFYAVGYSPQRAMMLHSVLGAVALFFLYKISERRFSPESALLCVLMCALLPLFLYITWSGWVVVWAFAALAGAVNFLDLYVLTKKSAYYFLAALFILCAGMSRPEYYAIALIVAVFVPAPLYLRPLFVVIALSFPFAAYVRNYVLLDTPLGLRILNDSRKSMAWYAVTIEWTKDIQANVLKKNVSLGGEWLALAAVVGYGLVRARFLATIVLYFIVAFAGAYTARRISFNHEAYYFPHLMFAAPFAAALLWRAAHALTSVSLPRPGLRRAGAWAIVAAALTLNLYAIYPYFKTRALFRVDGDVKQVRDFIREHGGPEAPVVLDYHESVTWLVAEIGADVPYPVWMYTSVPQKRPPTNVGRSGAVAEEIAVMGAWIKKGFEEWVVANNPKYLVTSTDSFYAYRVSNDKFRPIYTMLGLRNAYGQESLMPLYLGDAGENAILGKEVLSTQQLTVYEIEVRRTEPITLFGCDFENWDADAAQWDKVSEGVTPLRREDDGVLELSPGKGGSTSVSTALRDSRLRSGAVVEARVDVLASDAGKLILILAYSVPGTQESVTLKPEHAGDGVWRELSAKVKLPEGFDSGKIYCGVTLRDGALSPAHIDDFVVSLLVGE